VTELLTVPFYFCLCACKQDWDYDRVANNEDCCPNTPWAQAQNGVDENGCSMAERQQFDRDFDRVCDNRHNEAPDCICTGVDQCPDTGRNEQVNERGCSESDERGREEPPAPAPDCDCSQPDGRGREGTPAPTPQCEEPEDTTCEGTKCLTWIGNPEGSWGDSSLEECQGDW